VEKKSVEQVRRVEVIAELVGVQGNLIVAQDDLVIASLRPKARSIPGKKYVALPDQNKEDPRKVTEAFINEILEEKDCTRTLVRRVDGVGKETARVICEKAKKKKTSTFALAVKQELDTILGRTSEPIGAYDPTSSAFFFPVDGMEEYASFSEALDRWLQHQEEKRQADEGMHEIRAAAKRAIAKTNKTIARLEEWLENAESAEKLQYDADLLMIYHREVPRKTKEVTLTDPATNEHVKIALDPSQSGLENAQALYERAKRLRRGRVLVRRKLKRLKDEIRLLEDGLGRVEEGVSMSDRAAALLPSHPMKKKNQTATAFRIYSIGGYTVRVGKNARQNDELLREAKPNDLWLHARGVAGSHVVVSRQDKGAISDEVVAAAARLAARHSKARHEKHVPVVITEVKHVRKPKGAPDGLVIVQQEDTLVVDLSVAEEE
jgi:predicted ribosome quality control (RQC) complex YloA/Tae2 family protein